MTRQEGIRPAYRQAGVFAALAILCIVIVATAFYFLYQEDERLEVTFLDVGQGDAALIQTPHGKTILVDGGTSNTGVLRRLGEELPFWEKNIDLVILSHPHDDHYGGLAAVFERYDVKAFMSTDYPAHQASYKELLELVSKESSTVIRPWSQDFEIDGVIFDFIYPTESVANKKFGTANNASIIFKLSYRDIDFLFTGDAEKPVEQALVTNTAKLEAEVLKLGHHGSDTSSTEAFLNLVKPRYAIASAGKDNSYGHPTLLIVNRLERLGITLFRTDQEGSIGFLSNGVNLFRGRTCLIGCSSL